MKTTCLREDEIAFKSFGKGSFFKLAALVIGLILPLVLVAALISNPNASKTGATARDLSFQLGAGTHRDPRTPHHSVGKKRTVVSTENDRRKAVTWIAEIDHDFPDSSVIYADGLYYAYSTQVYLYNVPFRTSTDGVHWSTEDANAMPQLPGWATFAYTWAPTVANLGDNHFLMFFVARDTASGAQCIGKAESNSPSGPFVDTSSSPFICDPSDGGDIDPHIFSDPSTGRLYLIWKLNSNAVGETTSLWVAPLSSDFDLVGTPRELLNADQSWQSGNIERPDMIEEDGVYYLFYAGNDYSSASYSIGYATCNSPLGPCVDSPDGPVLRSARGMSGPGGPSLFRGPQGLELAFSAWAGKVGYANGGYRAFYVASVTFRAGVPHIAPLNSTAGDLA